MKQLISCSGAASAFVSAVISLSMPSVDAAPAAQPSPDQPRVVRDDSSGSAFQEALEGELSSGTGDSQQASADNSDSQPVEKPKIEMLVPPSVIVAILSAVTPVLPAASFGLFSAGDQAGAPETSQGQTVTVSEAPVEPPVSLPLPAPAAAPKDIAAAPNPALAFAMRLVDLTPECTPVPIPTVQAQAPQPEQPQVTQRTVNIAPQPVELPEPVPVAAPFLQTLAAPAPVEVKVKPAPVLESDRPQVQIPQPVIGQKLVVSSPAVAVLSQPVAQETRKPDPQPALGATIEQSHLESIHVEQPRVERAQAEPIYTELPQAVQPLTAAPVPDQPETRKLVAAQPAQPEQRVERVRVEQVVTPRQTAEQPAIREAPAPSTDVERPSVEPAARETTMSDQPRTAPSTPRPAQAAQPQAEQRRVANELNRTEPRVIQSRPASPVMTPVEQRPTRTPAVETAAVIPPARVISTPAPITFAAPVSTPQTATQDPAPVASAPAVNSVERVTPEPPVRPSANSPVTDISISVPLGRMNAPGEERVAIRMVQRAGEIHVSVRTPDAQSAQSLRQDLDRLSSSLDEVGFRTETWRPAAVNAPAAPTETHKEFSQDTANRDQTGADAHSGGNQGRSSDQRRRQQEDRPRWVEELEMQTSR